MKRVPAVLCKHQWGKPFLKRKGSKAFWFQKCLYCPALAEVGPDVG